MDRLELGKLLSSRGMRAIRTHAWDSLLCVCRKKGIDTLSSLVMKRIKNVLLELCELSLIFYGNRKGYR